ncbi:LytR C-terminal domain-containing protein [Actinoplanes sp. LDG1-06]|uniref:LytR C-terminal domain-containing protein n=1 Tax=Paractinoplanes ovalisporus TaxID=2810368 RepID=A0ABS2AFR3_9ACTN|nr:LytR C-terminal domain-containing protein [Actinoplanes ovalisporus]MBM2618654.1 LytR C-terminal domain-containing protein [Actinoplanes ovalisporus]
MRALFVVGFLVVAAIVVTVVAVVRDTQANAAVGQECPAGAPRVSLTLPDEAAQVKLRVLNGTRTPGVAEKVTEEFKNRGFVMQKPGDNRNKLAGIAVVRYGPKTVGAAQWIRAYFLGEAEPQYSSSRTSDVIDIVIGNSYRQLATYTEVNQSLAQLSEPTLPPGTCEAP